jgi:two-component system, cell cycle response regulator
MDQTIMLGAHQHADAGQRLARPINLMLVVRALDTLPRRAAAPAKAAVPFHAAPAPVPRTAPARMPASAFAPAPAFAPASAFAPAPARAFAPVHAPAPAAQIITPRTAAPQERRFAPEPSPSAKLDHILIVDDSDVALRFMASRLHRFGFEVHLARSGEEAIQRVSKRHFEFVFLDVMMEGLDGFQTCKAIKRHTYPAQRPAPTVVMVTSRGTMIDKLRGTMAGCDAYLTKPLREDELLKVVGDREVQQCAYADTFAASHTVL